MSLFSNYLSRIKRRISIKLKRGVPIAVYIPYSIDQRMFIESLGYKVVDLFPFMTRYPSRFLDRLKNRINYLFEKGYNALANIEYLYHLYPRERNVYFDIIQSLEGPVLVSFSNRHLYNLSMKNVDFESLYIDEASLDDLFTGLSEDKMLMSEGSISFKYLSERVDEHFSKIMMLLRDSNERYLLFYFAGYRGVGKLARIMGPELGTYLNRLIKRGLVFRAGNRRGVYFIRDPLIRLYIRNNFFPNQPIFKFLGYGYLIKKFFEGVKGRVSIPSYNGEVYLSEIQKFYYVDKYTFCMEDLDRVRYIVRIMRALKEDIKIFGKSPSMEKILIVPSDSSSRILRSYEKIGVNILRVSDLNSFSRFTEFPRIL